MRNSHIGAPVNHAFDKVAFLFIFSLPLSPLATTSLSTSGARPSAERITLLPALTFLLHPFLFFLRTLGNNDQHLGATVRHQYAPTIHSLALSSFLLTFLLYLRHNDDTYTHSLTTPLLPYHRTRLLSRDAVVFKQPPRSRVASSPIAVCFSSFLSFSLTCVLVVSSQHSRLWNRSPQ